MKRYSTVLFLFVLVFALAGCRDRTDRSEGTVLLSVTDFDGLPVQVSATDGPFSVEEIELRNIPKEPGGVTSDLMSIELRGYEIVYRRRDTGTRQPPSMFQSLFSIVPVNGTTTLENVPILLSDQVLNPPLSDLRDFGVDRETGSQVVVLDVRMRFFGRTLSGDDIASDPAVFTIEVTP
ncbi:MAG TPA: hypothetical protein VMW27_19955 [Thermoanaerobaculia bacterium]|nr:hypothetical protein [Thermoanaerobaculia bacterium]